MSQTRPVLFLARMAGAGRRPEPAATSPQNLTAILAFLNAVSRACSESPTPEAATHDCLGIVARFTGWPIAHAYRRRPDGSGAMASMRAWHLAVPDDASEAQAFVAASEGAVFAPGQGLVGRVAASGAPISCADVTILPGFVRAETASRNGVRGCFMFPVRVGDNVEIVLEFFSRDQAVLKDDLLELMAYVADRLALSITEHAQRNRVAALMRALDNVAHQLAETTARVESGAKSVQAVAEAVDERRIQVDRANGDASRDIEAASRSAQDLVILSREAGGHAGRIEVMAGGSARILDEAVTVFTDLQNRIGDVGQISKLIGTIASQTNLLALNATIEAARAGAAGRGFAVVASEVKALSHRVTQATAEIAAQVDQLRQVAARSTDSLSRVRSEIGAVQRTASDIAQVSASHQDAADTIASGVTRARTTILQAAGHLEALRSTTAAALASSQVLGETSARLRDQGRELGQATRQLAGSGR